MAPEVALEHEYTRSIDIWAIGIIMHMLLTGKNNLERTRFLHSTVILENMYSEFLENASLILIMKKISVAKGRQTFNRAAKLI